MSSKEEEFKKKELEKWRKENNVEDPEVTATHLEGEPARIKVTIKGEGIEQEKERLWLEMKDAIADKYNELGIENFEIDSIKSVSDMNYHRELLNKLEEKQSQPLQKKEPPSDGKQALEGNYASEEHTFPVDFEDLPLDLIGFESEKQAFDYLKKVSSDTSDKERQTEANRLLKELYAKTMKKSQTWEFEGKLSDTQKVDPEKRKGKWKRKR